MSCIQKVSIACKVLAVVSASLGIVFVALDNDQARLASILSSSILLALGAFLSYYDRRRSRGRQ